jgi:hypothetical protein
MPMSLSHLPRTTGLFKHHSNPSRPLATRAKRGESLAAKSAPCCHGHVRKRGGVGPDVASGLGAVPLPASAQAARKPKGPAYRTAPIRLRQCRLKARRPASSRHGLVEACATRSRNVSPTTAPVLDAAAIGVVGNPSGAERRPPRTSESKSLVMYRCSCRRPPPPVAYSRHGNRKSVRQCDRVKKFLQRCKNHTVRANRRKLWRGCSIFRACTKSDPQLDYRPCAESARWHHTAFCYLWTLTAGILVAKFLCAGVRLFGGRPWRTGPPRAPKPASAEMPKARNDDNLRR